MRYLSDEWLDAANAAVQGSVGPPPGSRLVIDQHVDGGPSWRIVIADTAHIERYPAGATRPDADATFRQNIETAQAVASGATDAHQAFLLGAIRFEGNIDALIERREVFQWLSDALAPVLARTTWTH